VKASANPLRCAHGSCPRWILARWLPPGLDRQRGAAPERVLDLLVFEDLKQGSRTRGGFLLLAALSSLILTGCDEPMSDPVVVLDDWWNVVYAKNACASASAWQKENASLVAQVGCESVNSCPEMTPRVDACRFDPVGNLYTFETELETQFASNPTCKGVQVVSYKGPQSTDSHVSQVNQDGAWWLSFNYSPGARKQNWAMSRTSALIAVTSGEGDPKEIADTVCSIVTQQGAKILN
jgi:hypothetical protein